MHGDRERADPPRARSIREDDGVRRDVRGAQTSEQDGARVAGRRGGGVLDRRIERSRRLGAEVHRQAGHGGLRDGDRGGSDRRRRIAVAPRARAAGDEQREHDEDGGAAAHHASISIGRGRMG